LTGNTGLMRYSKQITIKQLPEPVPIQTNTCVSSNILKLAYPKEKKKLIDILSNNVAHIQHIQIYLVDIDDGTFTHHTPITAVLIQELNEMFTTTTRRWFRNVLYKSKKLSNYKNLSLR
jgi:hypothetical protein